MRMTAYVERWSIFGFGPDEVEPWRVTQDAPDVIRRALASLDDAFNIDGDIAIHRTAQVEPGAKLKGPIIIGPHAFVSASALLRGGVFLDERCIAGPGVELKTTFMFAGSKAAHLNFVGDSIVGADVNIEAGAIVANYRNELDDKRIRLVLDGRTVDTGVEKFGALIGDGARIGANAVIAPGAVLARGARVPRLGLVDQYPDR